MRLVALDARIPATHGAFDGAAIAAVLLADAERAQDFLLEGLAE